MDIKAHFTTHDDEGQLLLFCQNNDPMKTMF